LVKSCVSFCSSKIFISFHINRFLFFFLRV
jgi:hypothetical protein